MNVPYGLPVYHLQIGECALSTTPLVISTVLGSCVGITFFHPASLCGAMFHALLPKSSPFVASRDNVSPCKFVDTAIETLFSRLAKRGIDPEELVIKLFGGAETMFQNGGGSLVNVASQNVITAETILAEKGLKIRARDVGGGLGRQIFFYTHTGEVWLHRLKRHKAG
ncbi:MAG TPA: chemotaxis protein CheD [Desulfonatronum sp.]|nr:chemotaxis protein CheD [Desulfonatronum sp.]